jgi:hypothetical protein
MPTLQKLIEQARATLAEREQTDQRDPVIFIYQPGDLSQPTFDAGGPGEPVRFFLPANGRQ